MIDQTSGSNDQSVSQLMMQTEQMRERSWCERNWPNCYLSKLCGATSTNCPPMRLVGLLAPAIQLSATRSLCCTTIQSMPGPFQSWQGKSDCRAARLAERFRHFL